WSIALAEDGARPVALDQSRAQLEHARRNRLEAGVRFPPGGAAGGRGPFPGAPVDLGFCDPGALAFCDPGPAVPGGARVARVGGRVVFSQGTPLLYLTYDEARERQGRRLRRPYFGMRRFHLGDGTIDFQLPTGTWIRLFREHGLIVDDLVELRAPKHATSSWT